MTTRDFNVISFLDDLTEKLNDIERNGVGLHRKRSRSRAMRNAERKLIELGWTQQQAADSCRQALDMHRLQMVCEEE